MLPRIVAFDLDDTLAPSKTPLPDQMVASLLRLLEATEVCIISGGHFGQFESQVLERIGDGRESSLDRLHLMPTCGTQYLRHLGGQWRLQYSELLSSEQRSRALSSLEDHARRLGYWEEATWGPILEDRGSQVTFSALGQAAPVAAKSAWDPDGKKRGVLRDVVAMDLPDLEVRSGGSTSIDVTRIGLDKAYGMAGLSEATGVLLTEMLFVGDRLEEGGNDYPVKALGVTCVAVREWPDTIRVIDKILALELAA
jgi:HAD superfamily hydrolase (TIGR01484 family)